MIPNTTDAAIKGLAFPPNQNKKKPKTPIITRKDDVFFSILTGFPLPSM